MANVVSGSEAVHLLRNTRFENVPTIALGLDKGATSHDP